MAWPGSAASGKNCRATNVEAMGVDHREGPGQQVAVVSCYLMHLRACSDQLVQRFSRGKAAEGRAQRVPANVTRNPSRTKSPRSGGHTQCTPVGSNFWHSQLRRKRRLRLENLSFGKTTISVFRSPSPPAWHPPWLPHSGDRMVRALANPIMASLPTRRVLRKQWHMVQNREF